MQGTYDFTTAVFSRSPTSSYSLEELGNSMSVFPVLCVVYHGNSLSESLVRELGEADVWIKVLFCLCYPIHPPR